MSRIIQINGTGKERDQLVRSIVLAMRELARQTDANDETRDLAAYISMALDAISSSIDPTVSAWEKRGYWLKADRFRLEWDWTGRLSGELGEALIADDWTRVAGILGRVADKFQHVKLPQRNRLGAPWVGAWEKLPRPVKTSPADN
jgi:hypothetical protein